MTTSTLRPDSAGPIAAVNFTANGAATLWQCTSDNTDASYADGVGANCYFTVNLGTVSLPAGAVTKTLTVRSRSGGGGGGLLGVIATTPTDGTLASVSTGALSTPTTTTGSAAAVSLSQTQIDALYLSISTISGVRVHELYLDLVYATLPTVSVSAPTGTVTTTTAPAAVWTYTAGSDGDIQSRYQVRSFTAAQYGIGGFDPATSPATYDSGVVVGSATSATAGVLPPSSVNMRTYVRVAQTINGTPQWSAWAFSTFTMNVPTSDVQSVVAAADSANGRIGVTVNRNTGTAAWTSIEIQRTDDGGSTWSYVRGSNAAAASGNSYSTFDYEAAIGLSVTYRARATYLLSGLPVSGAWLTSNLLSWTSTSAWLKCPTNSAINKTVRVRQMPDPERDIQRGVFHVLGAENPTVVTDVRQGPNGQWVFQTRTAQEAADIQVLLKQPFLLLQLPSTWDYTPNQYMSIGKWSEVHLVQKIRLQRHWAVSYDIIDTPPTS